jgi:hypothetical protein
MAMARFSTAELETLCELKVDFDPQSDIGDYHVQVLKELIRRHENGYIDVIADKHEAQKYRLAWIDLLHLRNKNKGAEDYDFHTLKMASDAYKESYSRFRTGNLYSILAKFHLFRFFFLGLFLTVIGISSLPLSLGGIIPAIGTFLTTYDFTAHMIFGIAGSLYLLEVLTDTFMVLNTAIRAAWNANNDGWNAFKNAFKMACKKGNRPVRFENAFIWTLANGLGFIFTGFYWDSTSFSSAWTLPAWNTTIFAHWAAAGFTILGLVHDCIFESSKISSKIRIKSMIAAKIQPNDNPWYTTRIPLLFDNKELLETRQKNVGDMAKFLLAATLFYASCKIPWSAIATSATTSASLFAPLIPWIAPTLGIAGGCLFLYASASLLNKHVLKLNFSGCTKTAERNTRLTSTASTFKNASRPSSRHSDDQRPTIAFTTTPIRTTEIHTSGFTSTPSPSIFPRSPGTPLKGTNHTNGINNPTHELTSGATNNPGLS